MKENNLTDQKFSRWTVGDKIKKKSRTYYICTCECGTVKEVAGYSLKNGDSTSCGCYRNEMIGKSSAKNKVGRKFGKLLLIERLPNYKNNKTYYKCLCDCGKEKVVSDSNLETRQTKSCGCDVISGISRRKDITGQRFGELVALEMLYGYKCKQTYAKCLCDCGNEIIVSVGNLKKGASKSCGCFEAASRFGRNHKKDLQGQKFGMLMALENLETSEDGHAIWDCICDCGNHTKVKTGNLMRGHTKSCGCNRYEANALDLTGMRFGKLTAIKAVSGSGNNKRKWKCKCDCGKIKYIATSDLTTECIQSCGCLSESKMETYITELLTSENIKFNKQHKFTECKHIRPLPFDFYLPEFNIAIEYDGMQHFEPIEFFGGQEGLEIRQRNDSIKNKYCIKNNIRLMRLPYTLSKDELQEKILSIKSPVTTTVMQVIA